MPHFAVVRDGSFQCGSQSCTEKMQFSRQNGRHKFRMVQEQVCGVGELGALVIVAFRPRRPVGKQAMCLAFFALRIAPVNLNVEAVRSSRHNKS